MDEKNYDCLKLANQICFPLYAASKEMIKRYKPFLDKLDLTYTQYITMMVLWEKKQMNVKELGQFLFLDSGTLTPVLKKLEAKRYITRARMQKDERNVLVCITAEGERLKEKASLIPGRMAECVCLDEHDARTLYALLYKVLNGFKESRGDEE